MRKLALILLVAVVPWSLNANAQGLDHDYMPVEMLYRTLLIKLGNEQGTAFTVEYEGKMYIVTARHVVAGAAARGAVLQVWQEEQWKDYHTVKTIFPSSGDVDIAIFETNEKVEKHYRVFAKSDNDSGIGHQVWFFGYPWGIATHFTNGKIAPFVKQGMVSAIDATRPDAVVLYVDGFNNPGFSGGPIVFWNSSSRAYEIIGVIKGYREDSVKVVINGQHADTNLLVNSGILVGYSINHALKAIEDSQKQDEPIK